MKNESLSKRHRRRSDAPRQTADEYYRAGWVVHQYRYRFKSWPDDEMIDESLLLSDLPEKECDAFKKNLKLAKR
jgi:hypothetical protein